MSRRPTPNETAAMIVFPDRYAAQPGGAVEFWRSLSPAEQDQIDHLVRAVAESLDRPDPTIPRCPKRCDVSTRAEALPSGRWVCYACGTEFDWPIAVQDAAA